MAPATRALPRHIPQFDGLRTLAVFGVLIWHFLPEGNAFREALPWGDAGVRLFFVLSGYLITGILLTARRSIETGERTPGGALRVFYLRRFLRIFPIYYLMLLVSFMRGNVPRDLFPWFVTYTQNVLFARLGELRFLTHFWSLAVEEQFYLVWPWVVLLAPRRRLPAVFAGAILLAPASRLIGAMLGHSAVAVGVLTPACLDTLGAGALLALAEDSGLTWEIALWTKRALVGGLALLLPLFTLRAAIPASVAAAVGDLGMALVFSWVVHRARIGFTGVTGSVLESAPMTSIGRISYGVYVYHKSIGNAVYRWGTGLPSPPHYVFTAVVSVVVTIAVAGASWRFFEGPLNALKDRFGYAPAPIRATLPTDG